MFFEKSVSPAVGLGDKPNRRGTSKRCPIQKMPCQRVDRSEFSFDRCRTFWRRDFLSALEPAFRGSLVPSRVHLERSKKQRGASRESSEENTRVLVFFSALPVDSRHEAIVATRGKKTFPFPLFHCVLNVFAGRRMSLIARFSCGFSSAS